jgi:hypothetical protein
MNWLVLLSHAFNPLLVSIDISDTDESKPNEVSEPFLKAIALLITSFIAYLLWVGAHFIVIELFGSGFDFDEFIGEGQGYAYFLPFILGGVILVLNYFVIPALQGDRPLLLVKYLRGVIQFFGVYFMLINYLAWIAR